MLFGLLTDESIISDAHHTAFFLLSKFVLFLPLILFYANARAKPLSCDLYHGRLAELHSQVPLCLWASRRLLPEHKGKLGKPLETLAILLMGKVSGTWPWRFDVCPLLYAFLNSLFTSRRVQTQINRPITRYILRFPSKTHHNPFYIVPCPNHGSVTVS